ncbi:hypothetical protein [Streptomyces sp. DH12]|uniref:hypothetical protein n=1 Tax=Streptomyces sp. DH12 TaxID=2857010 RepID=UPI001E2D4D17|nr:hypothetical protein [Streptomyces sp. DH12]
MRYDERTAWMDAENERYDYREAAGPRYYEPHGLYLYRTRRRLNQQAMNMKPPHRARRVVAYVCTWPGEDPGPAYARLEQLAADRGWEVRYRIHDDTGPQPSPRRPGWARTRSLCVRGFADGVLLTDRHQLDPDPGRYEEELRLLTGRLAFVQLCVSEAVP